MSTNSIYYEAVSRSDSNDFQDWEQKDTEDCTPEEVASACISTIQQLGTKVELLVEENFMMWYDSNGPLIAITYSGTGIEDFRDLWGPIAYKR